MLAGWIVLTGFVGAGAPAEVLHTLVSPNEEYWGQFGFSVSAAGDVNGDGYADVIVGARWEDVGVSGTGAGRAYVFSGEDGRLLLVLESPSPEYRGEFGVSVSGVGDVDGDEYDDVIVGAYLEGGGPTSGPGRAYVFSGHTGNPLHTLQSTGGGADGHFGISVSGPGDVDGDGCPDMLVGASRELVGQDPAGRAHVFSGRTGMLLHTLSSPNAEYHGSFGRRVAGVGDVNEDSHADVIVGAYWEDCGAADAGRAYVFSGDQGDLLYILASPNPEPLGDFGWSLSGVGDVNDDGCPDIAVGALQEDVGAAGDAGRIYVLNGRDGGHLYVLQSPAPEAGGYFGFSVSVAGDANGDGCTDILVGAPGEDFGSENAGAAYVFNGADGRLVYAVGSPNAEVSGGFGGAVCLVGDSGWTYPRVTVGASLEDVTFQGAGRAYVFELKAGCLVLSGTLVGGALRLEWTSCAGAASYWVFGADNDTYFCPGLLEPFPYRLAVLTPLTLAWPSPAGVGDPDHNWTYQLVAVSASAEAMCFSNRLGEFDFGTQPRD
jgi:hypothetical protein